MNWKTPRMEKFNNQAYTALDIPGNNCTANALPGGYTLRPDIVPGIPLINKNWKKNALNSRFTPYLNPAAFAVPGQHQQSSHRK